MRLSELTFIAVACLAGGCGPGAKDDPGPKPESPSPQTAARCGGSDPASGFHWVVSGTDSVFYTASTRQHVRFKPDTRVKTRTDPKGNVTGLTVVFRDNNTNIDCACPAGCKSDPGPGHGCVIEYVPGGGDASCTGDCVTENSCCTGCGFMAPF